MRPQQQRTTLEAEGWTLAQPVAGLPAGQLRCAARMDDRRGGAADAPVLQAVFSDGLTHVSVFIEPYEPQRHTQRDAGPAGRHRTPLMQRRGDHWVTVVGDVPPATLQAVRRRPRAAALSAMSLSLRGCAPAAYSLPCVPASRFILSRSHDHTPT